jgi:hypothetical protein
MPRHAALEDSVFPSSAPALVSRSRTFGSLAMLNSDDTRREPLIDVAGPVPDEAG